MFAWLREHRRSALFAVFAALALRTCFFVFFRPTPGDERVYTEIAFNWLHHGVFGFGEGGDVVPTLIRLPGYPAFLAVIFAIFGKHTTPVLIAQMLIDTGTCFLIARIAVELFGEPAGLRALWLAAV